MVRFCVIAMLLISGGAYASQDPTAPLGWQAPKTVEKAKAKKKAVAPVPTLQSIVCIEGKPCYAILNDVVVEKGKTIQGYLAKRIQPEFVDLIRGGKQWRLELFPSDVKH
ncbi:MSHA biogenesis protein MshK [Vibrio nigripulchritudo MADA3029]|uniref:hypothetical protein n=1 Tax=Vibrio nigripulchritudo TaxID=28173 RepID=UPI0003B20F50|nr:hypothetical protein [Vibrio nigripulchritudo]KJY79906.1 MSHA biogenesis protein MshK [Vibrio nigripulchritudo]CCN49046.1 MSHA biogenesis protein MshK [Vibrio nigripulchritudo MADA3020]CCN52672.1 MSHA biogenesis protein MshK [Vibrio nigripulchritudo MADA3021]CCN61044.1 MSHA biogenesis protein MshK [Vibrio nigripulchritudo MADA3029]